MKWSICEIFLTLLWWSHCCELRAMSILLMTSHMTNKWTIIILSIFIIICLIILALFTFLLLVINNVDISVPEASLTLIFGTLVYKEPLILTLGYFIIVGIIGIKWGKIRRKYSSICQLDLVERERERERESRKCSKDTEMFGIKFAMQMLQINLEMNDIHL